MRRWIRTLVLLVSAWCLIGSLGFVFARWHQQDALVEVFAPMASLGLKTAAVLVVAVPLIGAYHAAGAYLSRGR